MITPELYLFGYVVYTVEDESLTELLNIIRKNGLNVRVCKNKFALRLDKIERFEALIASRVKFNRSSELGIGGFIKRASRRYGALLALVIFLLLFFFSTDIVWDVRIEGSDALSEAVVRDALSECGLSVGERWSRIDKSRIESQFLADNDSVAWININQRGCVAYVTVREREGASDVEKKDGYANIVAARDAVIEEITVVKGYAMVKVGDIVKAGDLLISGVYPSALGGGFCYAEGVVKGRVSDDVRCEIPLVEEVKEENKRQIKSIRLNFFKFSINIFKSYRNFGIKYDIIEKNKEITIDGKRVPISFTVNYASSFDTMMQAPARDEIILKGSILMNEKINDRLRDSTLLRIKTEAEFTDRAYIICTSFVSVEDISKEMPFSVSGG